MFVLSHEMCHVLNVRGSRIPRVAGLDELLQVRISERFCEILLHKVAQFHHLIQELLQIIVGNFAFERGHEGLGFFGRVWAQAAWTCESA